MSTDSSFDSDFFQKLLASAFAVQQSGMNAQSLTCIVEIQRAIKAEHLDVEGTMQLIVECARHVANASGVTVGRLKGDQLLYGAGSGSAASIVGRRVVATFSTSAPTETRSEILRVENAETDARIEAAVCRQFGAKSLLILPIYHRGVVAGVMQVLFGEAHPFGEQEVRVYRVMAGLVGEAMSRAVELEQERARASQQPAVQPYAELMPAPTWEPLDDDGTVPDPEKLDCDAPATAIAESSEIRAIGQGRHSAFPSGQRASGLYVSTLISGLAAVGVLVFFSWILYRDRPSTMFSDAATAPNKSTSVEAHLPLAPAPSRSPTNPTNGDAVGYGAPDEKALRLAPHIPRGGVQSGSQVRYFGDDVTVRFFPTKSAPMRTALGENKVRRISDDVTVRVFGPSSVDPQGQGSETSGHN